MNEARFAELETKLAFLEHTTDELNTVVQRQQQELDATREALRVLASRFRETRAVGPQAGQDEPPPHY